MVFTATESTNGTELWLAGANVALLKNIEPGPLGNQPRSLRLVNGVVVFQADTTANGTELWRTAAPTPGP